MDVSERFWSKVRKTDGCWLWTAGRFNSGYGQFSVKGRPTVAHRWAYEEIVGPIPAGLPLDHTCHNQDPACHGGKCVHRACVRPDHLEPVTLGTNTLRSPHTPASINAGKTACPLGHLLSETPNSQGSRYCIDCRRQQDRERRMQKRREAGIPAGRGIREKMKTHCPRGHEYTPENTRATSTGGRACKTCQKERDAQRAQQRAGRI